MIIHADFGRVSQDMRHVWHWLSHLTNFDLRLLGAICVFLWTLIKCKLSESTRFFIDYIDIDSLFVPNFFHLKLWIILGLPSVKTLAIIWVNIFAFCAIEYFLELHFWLTFVEPDFIFFRDSVASLLKSHAHPSCVIHLNRLQFIIFIWRLQIIVPIQPRLHIVWSMLEIPIRDSFILKLLFSSKAFILFRLWLPFYLRLHSYRLRYFNLIKMRSGFVNDNTASIGLMAIVFLESRRCGSACQRLLFFSCMREPDIVNFENIRKPLTPRCSEFDTSSPAQLLCARQY